MSLGMSQLLLSPTPASEDVGGAGIESLRVLPRENNDVICSEEHVH